MTPEELQRNVDFITASLARLSAAQEQDRIDRLESAHQHEESLKRHDRLIVRLADTHRKVAKLITWQSQRMDHMDKIHQDALRQNDNFHTQALRLLNMILDRLPKPGLPS
jgi:hypothetical protein